MKKSVLAIMILITILLSACQPNALEDQTSSAPAEETPEASGFMDLDTFTGKEDVFTCTAVTKQGERPNFVQEGDYHITPEDPAITLTVYNDFACDTCNTVYQILELLMETFDGDIELIYRYFPLPDLENTEELVANDSKSLIAVQAAEAAAKQDLFWDMYYLLNSTYETWAELDEQAFIDWILAEAQVFDNLDIEQFETDMFAEETITLAESSMETAIKDGVTHIPFIALDDSPIPGEYYDYSILSQNFGDIIALTRLEDIQFNECPEMIIDTDKEYFAKVTTDIGEFTIQLFDDIAPFTVNSFVFLSENDWYDDVYFHRIEPGFVAQVGDPTGTGMGNPGYLYSLEVDPDLTFDRPGLVAMANSGPTANGSQFFITYAETPHLNGSYTIFGEVIEGMDIVEDLQQTGVEGEDNTFFAIFIRDIEIIEQ